MRLNSPDLKIAVFDVMSSCVLTKSKLRGQAPLCQGGFLIRFLPPDQEIVKCGICISG